jgi:hypothetical protein
MEMAAPINPKFETNSKFETNFKFKTKIARPFKNLKSQNHNSKVKDKMWY